MEESKFTRMMERSSSINLWAKVNRMNQDAMYEYFLECYLAYRDLFLTRLKNGRNLRKVLNKYEHILEFGVLRPSEITRIVFGSSEMACWFAFMMWRAIERQLAEERIDKDELQIELTLMGSIPTPSTMESILYEQRTKRSAGNILLPEGPVGETARKATGAGVEIVG